MRMNIGESLPISQCGSIHMSLISRYRERENVFLPFYFSLSLSPSERYLFVSCYHPSASLLESRGANVSRCRKFRMSRRFSRSLLLIAPHYFVVRRIIRSFSYSPERVAQFSCSRIAPTRQRF